MAAGELITAEERTVVADAVSAAEDHTGLQMCVYLGPAEGDPRQHAESLLRDAQARSRPAVMLYVAPDSRRVEIVVAPEATARLDDAAAQRSVDAMLPHLGAGELARGLQAGLAVLAEAAGPARGDEPDEELPDVLG